MTPETESNAALEELPPFLCYVSHVYLSSVKPEVLNRFLTTYQQHACDVFQP